MEPECGHGGHEAHGGGGGDICWHTMACQEGLGTCNSEKQGAAGGFKVVR